MINPESRLNTGDIYLKSESGRYTYDDLFKYCSLLKRRLAEHHVKKNAPVALLAESSDELVLTIASCWLLGYPFIPLSTRLTGHEMEIYIKRLRPGIVLTEPNAGNLPDEIEIPVCPFPDSRLLSDYTESHNPDTKKIAESVFGYFFTSGTTSAPKIVPLKRRQMIHAAMAGALNFKPDKNGLWLLCLPLNHIGGISVILRSLLYGTGVYRLDRFSKDAVYRLLKETEDVEVASLVPTMLIRLLQMPGFGFHSRFKAILLGGGPVPLALQQQVEEHDYPVVYSYGMTETCAQIAATSLQEPHLRPTDTAGHIFMGNEIRILDNDGRNVPVNSEGMIWIKGPQVFDGYLDAPDIPVFNDDWFRTGDIGRIDQDGNIYIISRRSDLIVTGGENVNPFEVEDALNSLPFVREAAVVGEPDPEWGQAVVAVIVPAEGTQPVKLEQIRQELSTRLNRYKLPKRVIYTNRLPVTGSGKIKRQGLLEWIKKNKFEI